MVFESVRLEGVFSAGTIQYALLTAPDCIIAHDLLINVVSCVSGLSGSITIALVSHWMSVMVDKEQLSERSSTQVGSMINPFDVVYRNGDPFCTVVDRLLSRIGCGLFAVIKTSCSESPGDCVSAKPNPYCMRTIIPEYIIESSAPCTTAETGCCKSNVDELSSLLTRKEAQSRGGLIAI